MTEKIKEEITLLLIYLTGWEEDKRNSKKGEKCFRAWKGYRFELLNELERQKLIKIVPGGKSITLTDEGIQKALELKEKYIKL